MPYIFYVYLLVQVITITMDGMNNRLHAKQTDREQRSNRFTKERERQITERNLL